MNDRDRLIDLITNSDTYDSYECKLCTKKDTSCIRCGAEKLTDHLLANGVIVPPCKVGDAVYYLARNIHTHIEKVTSGKVVRIAITESGIDLFVNNYVAKLPYGKRSFLTKEEAERALVTDKNVGSKKEREQNG